MPTAHQIRRARQEARNARAGHAERAQGPDRTPPLPPRTQQGVLSMPKVMSIPVIPAPARPSCVSRTLRVLVRVDVGNQTVVCDLDGSGSSSDDPVLRFSVLDHHNDYAVRVAIRNAFRHGHAVAPVVVSTEITCGGSTETPMITGTSDNVAAVLEAIPHFYELERDIESRRALRSVYRWLSSRKTSEADA